ncbi:MAG: hypothetical protein GY862_10400 [Gammaproteobacteria bacterium]|nr:hypothetical protein [Gammaproteobacteria bacterium]
MNTSMYVLMKHILLLMLVLLSNSIQARAIKPFDLSYEFPEQGIPLYTETQVLLDISSMHSWTSGMAILTVTPISYVVPDSNAVNLQVARHIPFGSGEGTLTLPIPVTILADGEYDVWVEVTLNTGRGQLGRARIFSVVAEEGQTWFGADSVSDSIRAKVRFLIENRRTTRTGNYPEIEFDRLFDEVMQKRDEKARENTNEPTARRTPRSSPALITKGDTITFSGEWEGPDNTGILKRFSMHGVKITVDDEELDTTTNLPKTKPIIGYLAKGKFAFSAPRDKYKFKVTLESKFAGIKPDGSIDMSGQGIGYFQVLQQTGSTYTESIGNNAVYVLSSRSGHPERGSMWAAFHGMAEMVLLARQELQVDKKGGFDVIFAGSGSFFDPPSGSITIVLLDRNDWDVVAHEFGHAISAERNVEHPSLQTLGGDHDGSNQYDLMANSSTYHHKGNSVGLAFGEGFGTWFGTALLEHSGYKGAFENIGDKIYNDTEDTSIATNMEANTAPTTTAPQSFGEDTEEALHNLLWDLYDIDLEEVNEADNANNKNIQDNEANSRVVCNDCKDNTSGGLNGVWNVLDGGNLANISDFWRTLVKKVFKKTIDGIDSSTNDFLKNGERAIPYLALRRILNVTHTFVEFGIAPFLETASTQINLTGTKGPAFLWSQKKTGSLSGLNKFTLALYSSDLNTLVFKKDISNILSYQLVQADLQHIDSTVNALSTPPASLIAVVIGITDASISPVSGPYFSNPVELPLQPQPSGGLQPPGKLLMEQPGELLQPYGYWTGNASLISYHDKNANLFDDAYPYGITRDVAVLPSGQDNPVVFFQWQISKGNCDRLKVAANRLSAEENNVDITIGLWSNRSLDKTFVNINLPFIIGEENTGYTFLDNDNQWYVVGVALRKLKKSTSTRFLDATCTSELPTNKPYQKYRSIVLDSGHKWNGNSSIISRMFSHLAGFPLAGSSWPYGVFEDITYVHPSFEKPIVFFQWMASDVCTDLIIDAPHLKNSEKQVKLGTKMWRDSNYQSNSVPLPYTLRNPYALSTNDGRIWKVIRVAFDNPVSQTAKIEAKCSGN